MTAYVVDAGVAVKWYSPEDHRDQARSLLDRRYVLYAPPLIVAEFTNVLWKKVRRRECEPADATDALVRFRAVPLVQIGFGLLIEQALELALETDRTVYDCLYLALALRRGIPMVTTDLRFRNALLRTTYGPSILWVGDLPVQS